MRDVFGLTIDRVYCWQLLLGESDLESIYIKGTDNIVADAVSHLDYDKKVVLTRLMSVYVLRYLLKCAMVIS